jgi:salicylate hydroxylase
MSEARLDIAIAGAGIGGLASAALLSRLGHRVEIFDQFEAPAPVGSGLMLQETGLAVLERLQLREMAEALGASITRLHGTRQRGGRAVLDVRFHKAHPGLHAVGIQRHAVFGLLLEAALKAGAQLNAGTQIASADTISGYLTSTRGRRLGPFDLMVDALGVRSPLSSHPRRELPFGALWATRPWPMDVYFPADALEQRYRRADRMAGVMPSGVAEPGGPRTATYFWSLAGRDHAGWQRRPLADWKREAIEFWPETESMLAPLTDHEELDFASYRHRTHGQPAKGSLIHIGDSWHAASPQLGQGANMALLDAFALSRALRDQPRDAASVAARYLQMRRSHVRVYQAMSWMFTPVYQSHSRLLPLFRDWLAAPLMQVPPAPRLLAAMVSGAFARPLHMLDLPDKS